MRMTDMRKKVKQYIDEADDDTVKMVYSILQADKEEDWWDHLPKEVQKSILKGEKELDEEKGIPHAEVMKRYKKWLTK